MYSSTAAKGGRLSKQEIEANSEQDRPPAKAGTRNCKQVMMSFPAIAPPANSRERNKTNQQGQRPEKGQFACEIQKYSIASKISP